MSLHAPTTQPATNPSGVDDPTRLHTAWAERFDASDLDGMVASAEPPATFSPQPGVVVDGDASRDALAVRATTRNRSSS